MALTESECIYSWGFNEFEQLERNTEKVNRSSYLNLIELKENIFFYKICCGRFHSLLLFCDGVIYGIGSNYCKQLGISTLGNYNLLPIKLNISQKFTKIACHWKYDCFLQFH